jgi:hypothetical protein
VLDGISWRAAALDCTRVVITAVALKDRPEILSVASIGLEAKE